ncbi:MAG: RIP metalloprotease RseP, partial [Gammaproteobacteria bacterium]|nr:RIP metalloprotease RseP [Gammaproteobacteria bacterium]
SYAAQAGLASEDEILFVNGKRTPTWSAATVQLLESVLTDAPVAIEVQNQNGLQRSLTLNVPMNKSLTEPGALLPGIGIVPWRPQIPAVIGELERTSVAWRAGLREGDRLVAVDGEPLTDRQAWIALVRANPDKLIITDVRRDGLPLRITITPEAVESGGEVVGRIGAPMVVPEESRAQFERARTVQQHGPVEALGKAAVKTWEMSALTLRLLGKMLTGAVSLKNISGPINIAEYAGITASIGFVFYVSFLAIISVSLGVLNLLPIPILDGGHLFYFLVEFLKGSPVSEEVELIGQRIGILMLFILMSFAFYNDLARLFQ